jgi:D-arabinose 1-dehydrogenase-like Zn-dependent alcohol dehydrogenase
VIGSIQNGPEYLYEALQIAARGGVRVRSEEYPLDDVAEAYDRLVDGRVRFRAVLVDES